MPKATSPSPARTATKSSSRAKKPTATKKRAPKRLSAKSRSAVKTMQDPDPTPIAPMPDPTPAPGPEPMPGPEMSCQTCGHMPVNANALVGVLAAVIAILSLTLIGSSLIVDSTSFQLQAATSQGELINNFLQK